MLGTFEYSSKLFVQGSGLNTPDMRRRPFHHLRLEAKLTDLIALANGIVETL